MKLFTTLLLSTLFLFSVATAETVFLNGYEVELDVTQEAQKTIYDYLITLRAANVATASNEIKTYFDINYAAILDSTGISLQIDRLDDSYVRVLIPQNTDRLLVAARIEWIASGAIAAEGDTIRCTKSNLEAGLKRLQVFYPNTETVVQEVTEEGEQ